MTTTQLHERSIHIDAPVAEVFDFVEEPANFIEAFPEKDRAHMALIEADMKPREVGSTYRLMGRMPCCSTWSGPSPGAVRAQRAHRRRRAGRRGLDLQVRA